MDKYRVEVDSSGNLVLDASGFANLQWKGGRARIPSDVALAICEKRKDKEVYNLARADGYGWIEWWGGRSQVPAYVIDAIADETGEWNDA